VICLNSMAKESIIQFIELLTLISSLFIGLLVLLFILKFILKKDTKLYQGIVHFLQEHYLFLGFLVSLVATLGSLFYSDVIGYPPCRLCWFQRIFMYPQTILFLIAMKVKRNTGIIWNSLVLSLIGGLIASYHYLMQIGIVSEGGCDVVGMTAKCSEYFGLSYGFITIPMMALVAFVLLVFMAYGKLRACEGRDIYNK